MISPTTAILWGSWLGTGLAFAAAFYERFKSKKRNEQKLITQQQDELLKVLTESRDAWKDRFDLIQVQFNEYREKTHKKAENDTVTILQLTEENGRLKAATDLTPVFQFNEDQKLINKKMLEGLDLVLAHLMELVAKKPFHSKGRKLKQKTKDATT